MKTHSAATEMRISRGFLSFWLKNLGGFNGVITTKITAVWSVLVSQDIWCVYSERKAIGI